MVKFLGCIDINGRLLLAVLNVMQMSESHGFCSTERARKVGEIGSKTQDTHLSRIGSVAKQLVKSFGTEMW